MDSIFKVKTPYTNHPYISCCLKVGYCERFGRFLFASKQLKAGEILVLEEPFFYSMDIKDDVLLKRCAFCVKVCKYEPLMCPTCNNSTYCSEECFNKSLHMLECSLVGKADKDDGYFLLMTRMLMKSINICGSLENLQKFIECRNKNLTLLDTLDNDFGKLNSCFNLESGNLKQDLKFSKSFVKSDNVKFLYKNDDQKFFLVKIILRILGILNRNSFSIEFSDGNRCGAVFPFASLINHSCSPNIERVSFGKQTAFVSIRPIEKNEQIFICYRLVNAIFLTEYLAKISHSLKENLSISNICEILICISVCLHTAWKSMFE